MVMRMVVLAFTFMLMLMRRLVSKLRPKFILMRMCMLVRILMLTSMLMYTFGYTYAFGYVYVYAYAYVQAHINYIN